MGKQDRCGNCGVPGAGRDQARNRRARGTAEAGEIAKNGSNNFRGVAAIAQNMSMSYKHLKSLLPRGTDRLRLGKVGSAAKRLDLSQFLWD